MPELRWLIPGGLHGENVPIQPRTTGRRPMSDAQIESIRIVEAKATEPAAVRVLEFLQPFVEREQVLPRTVAEMVELMRHGFEAHESGRLIGFVALEVYSRKLGEIQCLAVDPQYRRRGIGRRLVGHCVRRASDMGVSELMAISASEAMFRACGFDYSLPNQKRALFIQPSQSD